MHRSLRTIAVVASLVLLGACGAAVKRIEGEPVSKKNVTKGLPSDFPAIALPPGAGTVYSEAGVRHVFFGTSEPLQATVAHFSAELAKTPGAHVDEPQTFPDGSVTIRQIVDGKFHIVYVQPSATDRFAPDLGLTAGIVEIFYAVEPPPSVPVQ